MFGYDLIMIDCAWEIELYSDKGLGKAPQAHYECMPIEEIKAMPVGHLASPDCLLWCWCTAPMVDQALEAVAGWGFKYSTMGTWVKTTKNRKLCFGTGYRLRSCAEFYIIATVGRPKTTKGTRNAILGLRREHSRKPELAYQHCEQLMPGARKVDVFSREKRKGWDNWGKERFKFNVDSTEPIRPLDIDTTILDLKRSIELDMRDLFRLDELQEGN
jgi:N6-adenosine-specific RNA methylase IME4